MTIGIIICRYKGIKVENVGIIGMIFHENSLHLLYHYVMSCMIVGKAIAGLQRFD